MNFDQLIQMGALSPTLTIQGNGLAPKVGVPSMLGINPLMLGYNMVMGSNPVSQAQEAPMAQVGRARIPGGMSNLMQNLGVSDFQGASNIMPGSNSILEMMKVYNSRPGSLPGLLMY